MKHTQTDSEVRIDAAYHSMVTRSKEAEVDRIRAANKPRRTRNKLIMQCYGVSPLEMKEVARRMITGTNFPMKDLAGMLGHQTEESIERSYRI